ncbi:MAG TPA: methionine--tRNA ligase [Candidatus Binatia bacterium]|nr:methionine--tRNA ligase [Candidatus Binatia bacterium]
MDPLYLTTPIYYANAEPHLGHTYTTVVADVLARFWRARGREVFTVTGTDEHGDKIAQAAAKAGLAPKAFVDRISATFRSTWEAVGIPIDRFVRTTDHDHVAFVREVLADIHARGDIYFGSYGGLYCYGCERFYQERELVDGLCPDHRVAPTEIKEENYFFRMGAYQDRLLAVLDEGRIAIVPDHYRNEVLALLREPIGDLCISRPKSRLAWGIELPFDDRYVTYVWFDALLSYVSALRDRREALWPHAEHLIAKDILKPHAIYWPTMLLAAGLPLYRRLCVHGYWQMEAGKMSKSLGNVVRPLDMKTRYGMDAFRYYLLRDMAFGQDAEFSEAALVARLNGDLANGFGNLASRVLRMQQSYFQGAVQPRAPEPVDEALAAAFVRARKESEAHVVGELAFHRALEAIWRALDHANKYVTDTAPFTLAKDPARRPRVGAILHELCEALRAAAQLVEPFLPETARRLWAMLGLPPERLAALDTPWGTAFAIGHRTAAPEALFPRVETVPE